MPGGHRSCSPEFATTHYTLVMNQVLSSLGLEQHPDKTFIGHLERGFDFLGIQFTATGGDISQRREPCLTKRENCSALRARCIDSYNNIRRGQSTHRAVSTELAALSPRNPRDRPSSYQNHEPSRHSQRYHARPCFVFSSSLSPSVTIAGRRSTT